MVEETNEVVVDETTPQEGTVLEPEVGPQGAAEEEVETVLPSDVEEFVMPEKFEGKSAEEIAKSYLELEKFKGSKVETPTTEEAETPIEGAVQGDPYVMEFLNTGELSEESYAALEAEGNTRADIDDRMEFEAYKSKKAVDDLVEVIGGIENFTAMDEWAKTAFEPEQMESYSKELAGASKFAKQAILKDLYGQYTAAQNGEAPTADVIHTNERQTTVVKGYKSQHELQADMQDPRYGNDRSYTKAVEEKLAKSKIDW